MDATADCKKVDAELDEAAIDAIARVLVMIAKSTAADERKNNENVYEKPIRK